MNGVAIFLILYACGAIGIVAVILSAAVMPEFRFRRRVEAKTERHIYIFVDWDIHAARVTCYLAHERPHGMPGLLSITEASLDPVQFDNLLNQRHYEVVGSSDDYDEADYA